MTSYAFLELRLFSLNIWAVVVVTWQCLFEKMIIAREAGKRERERIRFSLSLRERSAFSCLLCGLIHCKSFWITFLSI